MCIFYPADPNRASRVFAFFAQGTMPTSSRKPRYSSGPVKPNHPTTRVGDDAHIVPQPRYSSGPVKPNHPAARVGDDAHIVP